MNFLAFDLGASGGKLFLAQPSGQGYTFREIHRFENAPQPLGGGLYWDFIKISGELDVGIRKAVRLTGDRVGSLGIDSFSNDFGLISRTGSLLCPVRCYRDKRTERYKDAIYRAISPERLYRLTGNQTALFNTLMQLAAMREAGEGFLLDNCRKLLFIPDLLAYFLTGRAVSEYTISSVSQMYSFEKRGWCGEILAAWRLPRALFGDLTPPGTVIGRTSQEYNTRNRTAGFAVTTVCSHDTASAFLASPPGNRAIISCGTWSLVGVETEGPVITEETFRSNLANEGGWKGRHRLLRNVMGSWLIQEARRDYAAGGADFSFDTLERLAGEAPPFRYLIDVDDPLFYQPGNMIAKIHDYCTARYGHGPEHPGETVRCVYESLALKYRWAVERLGKAAQRMPSEIHMVGGGSRAALLCRYTACACGLPVTAGPAEASAIGNLAVQMTAHGRASSLDEAVSMLCASCAMRRYMPEDAPRWEQAYLEYLSMYPQPE